MQHNKKTVVLIELCLVKICKSICFEHNVQEFIVLYFGRYLDYQNSFDNVVDKNLICNTITLFRSVQLFCVCRRKAPAGSAVDKP